MSDEVLDAEDREALCAQFTRLSKANSETSRRIAGRGQAVSMAAVTAERVEALVEFVLGPAEGNDVRNASDARLVFEVGWQERLTGFLERVLDQSTGPELLLPKGTKFPREGMN